MADRGDRRDVDDRAAALPRHHRDDVLHGKEGALEIDGEYTVPIGLRDLDHVSRLGDPDIVVEHVDAAIGLEACRHHRVDIGGTGNIRGERGRLSAFGGNDFCGFFRGGAVAIDAKHRRALARKGHGGRLAISPARPDRAGADHQRCLPLEPIHRKLPQRLSHPLLKRHVQAFRDVGAEAGGDGDAAAEFSRGGVAGPHRIAAGAEKRIGVGRLGFGGIERIIGIGVEDAGSFGAAAVGLHVDHFLVVPRQRERDLAPEIFRSLDVEEIGVGSSGRGIEFSRAQAAAAGNSLIVGELEVIRLRDRNQRHTPQRDAQTNFHDVVHPNRPYDIFLQAPVLDRNRNIVANRDAGNPQSVMDERCGEPSRDIDAAIAFVICSRRDQRFADWSPGRNAR
jgi:hypothetical protein